MSRSQHCIAARVVFACLGLCVSVGVPPAEAQGRKRSTAQAVVEQTAYVGPKKRLAVADLEVKVAGINAQLPMPSGKLGETVIEIPAMSEFGTGMSEILTTELQKTNRFVLLERKSVDDVLKEQQLAAGTSTADPPAAPKAGGIVGAQVIIRGAVTEFSLKRSSTGAGGILGDVLQFGSGSSQATVRLDIRMYDAVTGQIIEAVDAPGVAKSSGSGFVISKGEITLGGTKFDSTPLGAAVRQAIANAVKLICARMERVPWEARVALITKAADGSPRVYINAGQRSGVRPGDVFLVQRPGEDIKDPETHAVIGRADDTLVGKLKVVSVTPNLCNTQPIEGEDFQVNDIVQLPPAK